MPPLVRAALSQGVAPKETETLGLEGNIFWGENKFEDCWFKGYKYHVEVIEKHTRQFGTCKHLFSFVCPYAFNEMSVQLHTTRATRALYPVRLCSCPLAPQ